MPLSLNRPHSGGGSGDGPDKNYIHNQNSPSSLWIINHNLFKYPSVTIVNELNEEVYGNIEYLSINSIKITFGNPETGKAFIN